MQQSQTSYQSEESPQKDGRQIVFGRHHQKKLAEWLIFYRPFDTNHLGTFNASGSFSENCEFFLVIVSSTRKKQDPLSL